MVLAGASLKRRRTRTAGSRALAGHADDAGEHGVPIEEAQWMYTYSVPTEASPLVVTTAVSDGVGLPPSAWFHE